jgi:hypothetical protein
MISTEKVYYDALFAWYSNLYLAANECLIITIDNHKEGIWNVEKGSFILNVSDVMHSVRCFRRCKKSTEKKIEYRKFY